MTTMNPTDPVSLAREWDQVRSAFAASIMVNTPLSSLAQNLDGVDWPLAGEDQTPAAYIDLAYPELELYVSASGRPAAAALLVRILRETLECDRPFGEMAQATEASAELDHPLRRTLARLNIPGEFPLTLTTLDAPARELCRLEHLRTLGHFALFAQGLSQTVIVGGDFRRLLNALAQVDERAIATLVPFRPGSSGLHLAEALGQAAAGENPAGQTAHAVAWFEPEFAAWQRGIAQSRRFLPRQLAVLADDALEQRVMELLIPHLGAGAPAPPAAFGPAVRRWFGRWIPARRRSSDPEI